MHVISTFRRPGQEDCCVEGKPMLHGIKVARATINTCLKTKQKKTKKKREEKRNYKAYVSDLQFLVFLFVFSFDWALLGLI